MFLFFKHTKVCPNENNKLIQTHMRDLPEGLIGVQYLFSFKFGNCSSEDRYSLSHPGVNLLKIALNYCARRPTF